MITMIMNMAQATPVPALPSTGYRWVILSVGTGAQVAFAALNQALPSISPQLRSHFGLTLETVGLTFSAVILGQTLTQLAWGFAVDRLGDRVTMSAGLAGAAVTLAGAALAPGFGAFLLLLLASGMFGASINVASARAVSSWFAFQERGFALGIRQSALPLGGALGSALLPVLAISWGPTTALLAVAVMLAVAMLATLRWLREPPLERDRGGGSTVAALMGDRRLWRLTAGAVLLILPQFGLVGFTVLYLHDAKHVAAGAAAAALACMQLGGAGLRVAAGRWSDSAGQRVGPMSRSALGVALAALVATLLAPLHAALAALTLALAGMVALSWNGLALAAALELAGTARAGLAVGFLNTALSLAAVVSPLLFALVVSHAGWQAGFAMLAACGLGSHLVLRGMRALPAMADADVHLDGAAALASQGLP